VATVTAAATASLAVATSASSRAVCSTAENRSRQRRHGAHRVHRRGALRRARHLVLGGKPRRESRRGRHVPLHGAHDVQGDADRSAAEISEAFDRLGAELNAFTSKEYTCYYARVIDEHLPTAVEILSDMVCQRLLADDACEREREVVIEEIARMEDTPDDRIHELFAARSGPSTRSACRSSAAARRSAASTTKPVGAFRNATI
jgi:hypothetical protein